MRIWGAVTRGERGIRIAYLIPAEATVAERADHGRFLMWHKGAARRLLCLTSSAAFIAGVALVSHAFFFGRDVLGLELAGLGGVGLAALVFADGLLRPAGDVRTMMARMPGPDRPEAAWTGVWGLIEAHDHAGHAGDAGLVPLSDWRALQASVWELAGGDNSWPVWTAPETARQANGRRHRERPRVPDRTQRAMALPELAGVRLHSRSSRSVARHRRHNVSRFS